jgi:ATP-dependent protease HslVU (ClpYQ) ATPase subunit
VLREVQTLIRDTNKMLAEAGVKMKIDPGSTDKISDVCAAVEARESDLQFQTADQVSAKRWVKEASVLAHKLKDYLEVASNQAYVTSRIQTLSEDRFLRRYVRAPHYVTAA